jgi:hypothetical protein
MTSTSVGELVGCFTSWAARKLRRAKNPGKSDTSNFRSSLPKKNARDAVAN